MDYEYTLELVTEDGRPLERAGVTPAWEAALEWVHFEGIRAGSLPAETRTGPGAVEPIWDGNRGTPYVAAFRASVRATDGRTFTSEIPKTYVETLAHELAAGLVKQERLAVGDRFRWMVRAVQAADERPPGAAADDPFDIEDVARPLPCGQASLASFLTDSVFVGGGDETTRHIPVFFPQPIIDQAKELARRSADLETGGVLVGKLHYDDGPTVGAREIFVEITAQVPAPHTRAKSTKLTFTSETWDAVRAAIALRGRDELMAGWWHSHLDWCRLRDCPPERRRTCTGANPFFSSEDVHLHGACFGAGHQVALLISDSTATGGLTASVYGWSQGMVVARGFHVLHDTPTRRRKGADHAENIAA